MTNRNNEKSSKKINKRSFQRKLKNAPDMIEESRQDNLFHFMDAIILSEEEKKEFLSPAPTEEGQYITSEESLNKTIDTRIFIETQLKRILYWLTNNPPLIKYLFKFLFVHLFRMKLAYFDQAEDKNPEKIYKLDRANDIIDSSESNEFTIHNLGHATQLIQTSGMNILTDPVFGNLTPIIYPAMTKKLGSDPTPDMLPRIDVLLFSHNHRDHVDETSLRQLLQNIKTHHLPEPQLLVPLGDEEFFKSLGFNQVRAFEWHEQITLQSKTGQKVTFCSEPADHRSRRGLHDSHKSLVMGWTISPKDRQEILYFAGDTARLSDVRMKGLALDIYHLYQHKHEGALPPATLPKLINMEPGGPNYTRQEMKPTHQSAVDSIVSAFRLALALENISKVHQGSENKMKAQQWLDATATLFMHHNKYQLGPDRFNENVFIFNRLISYLQMSDEVLLEHERVQAKKSKGWSLFHRRKDFIIDGARELKQLAKQIWPVDSGTPGTQLIDFVKERTHFPLIRQKINSNDVFQCKLGEIIPDTTIPESRKLKGSKTAPSVRI